MIVTINNLASGTCIWCCQKSDDAVDVTFRDGLKGTLCRKHFWDALRSRAEQPREESKSQAKATQP